MYKVYEKIFGKGANFNFCVSKAMQEDLAENWGVRAIVLYDRPPVFYRKSNIEETHSLLENIRFSNDNSGKDIFSGYFIKGDDGQLRRNQNRPIILVSSTSWTKDENFDMLFDAMIELNDMILKRKSKMNHMVLIITGKGDMREHYEKKMKEKTLLYVTMLTTFLSYDDYRILLGSADLGICLHESSSGLDLPMKVVDMFGCGLPVCAYKYKTVVELISPNENGLLFENKTELAQQIFDIFTHFPDTSLLKGMQMKLEEFQSTRWDKSWKGIALPLFEQM